ncbi:hypothetical protein BDW_01520 [Bdellovibrio bacteriovorus W]|nr:hypothetical protein BDW_01520 [Bdellovibrio bacteriovorus W]
MKKLLAVATALTVAAPAAMASKARVEALGNSRQLVDVQYVFERPYLLHTVGDQVTLEWGGKDAANPHAEGGFIKTHNDMVFGLYLGKQGLLAGRDNGVAAPNTVNYLGEQNPINVLFGMKTGEIAWGLNLGYSNGKKDATAAVPPNPATPELKSSSMTLDLGARMGDWSVNVGSTLTGKTEDVTGNSQVEIKNAMNVGVDYQINDASQAYVTYNTYKVDNGTTDLETNATTVGYINTFAKTEDVNFFYGAAYSMGKTGGNDFSMLPVWMGLEANATSWMVFRASVSQNIIINETEDAAGNKSDLDSIAFNAGLGLKLGKGMLDATFGTANQGHLSFNDGTGGNFLSQVSYTYMF